MVSTVDQGIGLSITRSPLPQVKNDQGLTDSANDAKAKAEIAKAETVAKSAVLRQALGMMDLGLVYASDWATTGRVTTEAALTSAEKDALTTVWAPLIEIGNPLIVAVITTAGILTAKTVEVMRLNQEAKALETEQDERTIDNGQPTRDPEPITGSGSDPIPSDGSESNSGNRIAGNVHAISIPATTIGNNGGVNGSDG